MSRYPDKPYIDFIKSMGSDINNIKLSDYVKLSKDLSLPKKLQEFYKNLETIKETPEYKDKMKLYSKYFKENCSKYVLK